MLDWRHRTLSDSERVVLRRLAVFPAEFTLSSAREVAGDGGDGGFDVAENVASLVAKSLVMADLSGDVGRYHLLETTRVYAFGKLSASGELDAVAERHAEHANGGRAKITLR